MSEVDRVRAELRSVVERRYRRRMEAVAAAGYIDAERQAVIAQQVGRQIGKAAGESVMRKLPRGRRNALAREWGLPLEQVMSMPGVRRATRTRLASMLPETWGELERRLIDVGREIAASLAD